MRAQLRELSLEARRALLEPIAFRLDAQSMLAKLMALRFDVEACWRSWLCSASRCATRRRSSISRLEVR